MTPVTTPSSDAAVRGAQASDIPAIAAAHAAAWLTDYAHLLPQRAASVDPASLGQAWEKAVRTPPTPAHRVMVATSGQDLVGFVAIGPNADSDAVEGRDSEIFTLLVEPTQQRHGHGSRLLNASIDVLRQIGFAQVRAWVPEPDNVRQQFLESAGFAADGAARLLDAAGDGTTTVREVRLATTLEPFVGAPMDAAVTS